MVDRDAVDRGFKTLGDLWGRLKEPDKANPDDPDRLPTRGGFWHAGNILDISLTYLDRARPEGFDATARALADDGIAIFSRVLDGLDPTKDFPKVPPTTLWWDDYGWWGIAYLKAHDLTREPKYLQVARLCCHFMVAGGRGFGKPGDRDTEGGTWNYDPDGAKYQGIQNVITNALFLDLSARLFTVTREGAYRDEALSQYRWFDYHLGLKEEDGGARIVVSSNPVAWLVHQLPRTDGRSGWPPWTGDQGALLGGLMSLRGALLDSSDPADRKLAGDLLTMCQELARGAMTSDLILRPPAWDPPARVLHEPAPVDSDDGWRYSLDGFVGKGVLIRHLASFLGRCGRFVNDNAAAVARLFDEGDGYFPASWVRDPKETMDPGGRPGLGHLVRQGAGQDAMNAWLPVDLRQSAIDGFLRFRQVWEFQDFWTRANAFHAAIQFVASFQRRWPNDPVALEMSRALNAMVDRNIDYFRARLDQKAFWSDDFGWCGISSLVASDWINVGNADPRIEALRGIAAKCWENMIAYGYDAGGTARPVPHGFANRSGDGTNEGTKNTVTNANFLVLTLMLYNVTSDTKYLARGYDEYRWFEAWWSLKPEAGYLPYLKYMNGEDAAMVLERPHAKPDYDATGDPPWEEGWLWSGDQGLLLEALSLLLYDKDDIKKYVDPNLDPSRFEAEVRGRMEVIGRGARGFLFGPTDHVLREAPFRVAFGPAFSKDYSGGRGVLLRYLARLNSSLWNLFTEPLMATAEDVCRTQDGDGQFQANWTPADDGFNAWFKDVWGFADVDSRWGDWGGADRGVVEGVIQAAGLDALGAAIRTMG